MAPYDRRQVIREAVGGQDGERPVSSAQGPPTRQRRRTEREEEVPATPMRIVAPYPPEADWAEPGAPAADPGPASSVTASGAARVAWSGPAPGSVHIGTPVDAPTEAEPDPLPGYRVPSGRRQLFALLSTEVGELLDRGVSGSETRGRTIARALKIAAPALEERSAQNSEEDPWDDRGAQRLRRHEQPPLRVTFQWSDTQARALYELAQRCGEENYSRLISDAIEIAYGADLVR